METSEEIVEDIALDLDNLTIGNKYQFKQDEIPAILMLLITEIRKLNCNMEELIELKR
jgi:hypothetical protein